jgi:hypothetical protein
VSATLPKRFSLSLTLRQWQRLLSELQAMERDHTVHGAVPVEKQLERARAGEQLLVFVRCLVEEGQPPPQPSAATQREEPDVGHDGMLRRDVPLLRSTAKYLLTACDRLRRSALHDAWRRLRQDGSPAVQAPLDDARLWDRTMRDVSLQHGVLHPLSEMVAPLPLGEAELAQLGLPCELLLNGEDLLAS